MLLAYHQVLFKTFAYKSSFLGISIELRTMFKGKKVLRIKIGLLKKKKEYLEGAQFHY